jgi:hypothetical protein
VLRGDICGSAPSVQSAVPVIAWVVTHRQRGAGAVLGLGRVTGFACQYGRAREAQMEEWSEEIVDIREERDTDMRIDWIGIVSQKAAPGAPVVTFSVIAWMNSHTRFRLQGQRLRPWGRLSSIRCSRRRLRSTSPSV